MKIALFHEVPFGGARRVVYEYGRNLRKKHILSLYYVDYEEDKKAAEIFHNTHFYSFPHKQYKGNDWKLKFYKDTVELFKLYLLHRRIGVEINKEKFDFVFIHPSQFTQAPFLLQFINAPKIYYCQEPLRIAYDPLLTIPNLSVVKRTYEYVMRLMRKMIDEINIDKADVLLANSIFSKRAIWEAYKKDTQVCYLGVDTTIFKPLKIAKLYDIVFVGQKTDIKGYDLLLAALAHFKKKPKLKIIGGNGRKALSDEALSREYNRAQIVVALGRNEPFGLVALEAMACGIPVVAVAEGGYKESIMDGKTGFLVPPDSYSIYRAVDKLLQSSSLQKNMGRKARAHVETSWTWEKSISRLLEVVKICLREK